MQRRLDHDRRGGISLCRASSHMVTATSRGVFTVLAARVSGGHSELNPPERSRPAERGATAPRCCPSPSPPRRCGLSDTTSSASAAACTTSRSAGRARRRRAAWSSALAGHRAWREHTVGRCGGSWCGPADLRARPPGEEARWAKGRLAPCPTAGRDRRRQAVAVEHPVA